MPRTHRQGNYHQAAKRLNPEYETHRHTHTHTLKKKSLRPDATPEDHTRYQVANG